jgi:hypothetical protein
VIFEKDDIGRYVNQHRSKTQEKMMQEKQPDGSDFVSPNS